MEVGKLFCNQQLHIHLPWLVKCPVPGTAKIQSSEWFEIRILWDNSITAFRCTVDTCNCSFSLAGNVRPNSTFNALSLLTQ